MTTTLDIVTRALRRDAILAAGESADADDAQLGLDLLNSMLFRWQSQGVDVKHSELALADTFYFFVPPADASSEVIDALVYRGTWDASANTPALATGTGTKGYYYRVTTAGSTVLDDVTSWAVNDFAVFDGVDWLKSINSSRFHQAVVDLLAVEMTPDFGREPNPVVIQSARDGWRQIQAAYIKAPTAILDRAVMQTIQRTTVEELNR